MLPFWLDDCTSNCIFLTLYFTETTGLYGANNREALDIDIVCELLDDLVAPSIGIYYEKDEEKKVICK